MELGRVLLTGLVIGVLGNIAHFLAHTFIGAKQVKEFYEKNPNAMAEGMNEKTAVIRAVILTFVYGFVTAWVFSFGDDYLAANGIGGGFMFGLALWLGYWAIEYTHTTFARMPMPMRIADLTGYGVMLMGGGMIAAGMLV
ncbi:MAG: hypothetical protein ACM3YF_02635 [Candidatus Zixiibacteriota bacterium]